MHALSTTSWITRGWSNRPERADTVQRGLSVLSVCTAVACMTSEPQPLTNAYITLCHCYITTDTSCVYKHDARPLLSREGIRWPARLGHLQGCADACASDAISCLFKLRKVVSSKLNHSSCILKLGKFDWRSCTIMNLSLSRQAYSEWSGGEGRVGVAAVRMLRTAVVVHSSLGLEAHMHLVRALILLRLFM